MTLQDPKVYPHIEFGIPTSNNIGDITGSDKHIFERKIVNISYLSVLKYV